MKSVKLSLKIERENNDKSTTKSRCKMYLVKEKPKRKRQPRGVLLPI